MTLCWHEDFSLPFVKHQPLYHLINWRMGAFKMSRKCINSSDSFFYICGEFMSTTHRRNITSLIKMTYKHYLWYEIGDQEKPRVPHLLFALLYRLREWIKWKETSMPFVVPMIRGEARDHLEDCYFSWLQQQKENHFKKQKKIQYPNINSAVSPVPQRDVLPAPQRSVNYSFN